MERLQNKMLWTTKTTTETTSALELVQSTLAAIKGCASVIMIKVFSKCTVSARPTQAVPTSLETKPSTENPRLPQFLTSAIARSATGTGTNGERSAQTSDTTRGAKRSPIPTCLMRTSNTATATTTFAW